METTQINKPLRVVIAEENEVYLDALQNFIRRQHNVEFINICKTVEELFLQLKSKEINCLIIDEGFFDKDALVQIRSIKEEYPNLNIIGLSVDGSSHMAGEMISAGASGYISKWDLEKELNMLVQGN